MCVCAHAHICVRVCKNPCIHVYAYTCMCVQMHVSVFVCACTCVFMYAHVCVYVCSPRTLRFFYFLLHYFTFFSRCVFFAGFSSNPEWL